jgi:hypothetical protein
MNCANVQWISDPQNNSLRIDIDKAASSLLTQGNGIEINLKEISVVKDFNARLSLSEYAEMRKFSFQLQLLNEDNYAKFLDIEENVTNTFVKSVIESNKFLITEEYLRTFFDDKWTLSCFNDNNALKVIYPILNRCFESDSKVVYIYECSLVYFALLSFDYVINLKLENFNRKKIYQERDVERDFLCRIDILDDKIKQFLCGNNNSNTNVNSTAIVGGGNTSKSSDQKTRWDIRDDKDLKNMLNLSVDTKIKNINFNNNQGVSIQSEDIRNMFDFEVFDDNSKFEKQLHVDAMVRECFDDIDSLNNYTLLAVYPNTNGTFLDKITIEVTYLSNRATNVKGNSNVTMYEKYTRPQLEVVKSTFQEAIKTVKQRLDISSSQKSKERNNLETELNMLHANLEIVDNILKSKRSKKAKQQSKPVQISAPTETVSLDVIPSKRYSGDISNITSFTLQEVNALLTNVIVFLQNVNKKYQHLNITPNTIVYETDNSTKSFYLSDYNSITTTNTIGVIDPFYAHPDIYQKICSVDKNECVKHIKHVFTKIINTIYKAGIDKKINSKTMAYQLDKVFEICERCIAVYKNKFINLQKNPSLYSVGILLMEILYSRIVLPEDAELSKGEFAKLHLISVMCTHDNANINMIINTLKRNYVLVDTYTPMSRYKYLTNSNTNNQLSNDICFQNDKNTTFIYYVRTINQPKLTLNNDQNNNIRLVEIEIFDDNSALRDEDIGFFKNLSCKQNVLIYGSSRIYRNNQQDINIKKGVVAFMQEMIELLPKNKKFNNVTIIHECSDTNTVLYHVYNNKNELICKKIVNAITNSLFKDPLTNKFLDSNSGVYHSAEDKETQRKFTYRFYRFHKIVNDVNFKSEKEYEDAYNVYNTYTIDKVDETWWFKMYFDTPYCAFGRFIQFSGTCWFNTVINSLILVPSIAVILIYMYGTWAKGLSKEELEKFQNNATFDSCPANMFVKEVLFTIVYLIFVRGQKAINTNNNDFMAHFASIVRSSAEYGSPENYLKMVNEKGIETASKEYGGQGWWPLKSIQTLLKNVFPIEIADELEVQKLDVNELITEKWRSYKVNNKDVFPFTIVLHSKALYRGQKINKLITINGMAYALQSCAIGITNNSTYQHGYHAVAGFICNDKEYIYDSNNGTISTNWTKGDITNYVKYLDYKSFRGYVLKEFFYLIYVREDIKNIFEKRFEELGEIDI